MAAMEPSQKEYLARHGLLKFVAEMLGRVLEEKPEDPMKYMGAFLAKHEVKPRQPGMPHTVAETDIDSMIGAAIMNPTRQMGTEAARPTSPCSPARRISAARIAGQYLEKSDVLGKVRELLQNILVRQPEDPFGFMASYFKTGGKLPPPDELEEAPPKEAAAASQPKKPAPPKPAVDLSELMSKLQISLTQSIENGSLRQAIQSLPPRPAGYATPAAVGAAASAAVTGCKAVGKGGGPAATPADGVPGGKGAGKDATGSLAAKPSA